VVLVYKIRPASAAERPINNPSKICFTSARSWSTTRSRARRSPESDNTSGPRKPRVAAIRIVSKGRYGETGRLINGRNLLNPKVAMTLFSVEEISIKRLVITPASAVGSVSWRVMSATERFTADKALTWVVTATTAVLMEARASVMASPAAALSASVLDEEIPAVVESGHYVSSLTRRIMGGWDVLMTAVYCWMVL
jgi:hypothetical protein